MSYQQPRILGAALAGGLSQRFGSDKRTALWQEASLLDHTISALATASAKVVICGGSEAASSRDAEILADRPEPELGPLGGLCAALTHASDNGFDVVLSAPIDAHPIPDDLLDLLSGQGPAVLRDHWLFGLWPSDLAGALDDHLRSGKRSVLSWIEACGARQVDSRGQPPVNINTPPMLAALEKGTALGPAAEVHALRELDFETLRVKEAARIVPVETPVAIEFNGIGYAVMMATPTDLEDFVAGFALAEGLARPGEIEAVELHEANGGWVARANLPASSLPRIMERARTRVSESSCGICGIDSVAAALAPIDPVETKPVVDPAAIHKALSSMRSHQRLGEATGAAHAAAFCSFDGQILLLREDVGRHNALDKLIGGLGRIGLNHEEGFVLLSARCSQELVEKTVRAGIPMLVTISAPSSLAIARAREGRLTLLALARNDSVLVVNDPHRLL
ncbi:MAG TPA: formate dehydrogenase accessory sulfurtransferase FdhD [Erythrobacter sp.]|nr:formate dehydrogenase accessory sulfurtransferase FdhD [Erythrobacter sp.]